MVILHDAITTLRDKEVLSESWGRETNVDFFDM